MTMASFVLRRFSPVYESVPSNLLSFSDFIELCDRIWNCVVIMLAIMSEYIFLKQTKEFILLKIIGSF